MIERLTVPWLKTGDNAAMYPAVMMAMVLGDERAVNELFGWLARCMLQSAAHTTDYLVDMGTALAMGGPRTGALIELGRRVGLIVDVRQVRGVEHLELVADADFMHMRTAAELAAERQRKNDNTNPTVTAAVRLRDGDQCRWCGVVTWWGTADRKSGRVGTYDHLEPVTKTDKKATADTMVVACRSCNSARQDGERWERPLLAPPSPPHYSGATAAFIAKHLGITVVVAEDQRTGSQPVIASSSGPAASRGARTQDRPHADEGNERGSGPAASRGSRSGGPPAAAPRSIDRAPVEPGGARSGFTGSGRVGDGSDLAGSGRAGPGRAGPARAGRRRPRRGRRRGSS